ncbi:MULTISPECIES: DUF6318 family protein [Rothia]|jgi:hypothetical protein|nr:MULTISPECIES: DUF6318 family protein [Rothia]PZQ22148.1 MAG: transposase [Corynebacterium propinquum]MBF1655637.1 transposase [Rothia sp. (in: high G+C Gram-positive bacteria)]OFL50471.1 transposase [Rothia sp. HMSC062H08]OFP59458.1 transposase [Rothia sp. HMSC076D04]OFQ75436.1 transposase [Rothia sp. HMSC068E02]
MTSVILNRRTLLSGGTLLGLGALLAACGQQAANEASASAAPSETASATPSEMTSASASTAASDASSASATPSPVITRGYSGGSKAPDGEYRGADPNGPAQNVPKPASPEDGYREKSNEGLRKTLNAWIEWNNYGAQTGDYSQARKFVDSSFTELLDSYEGLEALYKRGGWIIAGLDHYIADGNPWIEGETYFWKAYREWGYVMYIEPNGDWKSYENDRKDDDTWKFSFKYTSEGWKIIDFEQVDD